ncbi:MAG: hypothetical protein SCK29_11125 [Bacillota bacterium]|nr:hypothetical protein [Bacillota bacterium]MDW7684656.1 hypothetical protein [Bacillota bacterium]
MRRAISLLVELVVVGYFKALDRLPVIVVSFLLGAMFAVSFIYFDMPLFIGFVAGQIGSVFISIFSGMLAGLLVSVYLAYRQLVRELIITARKTIRSLMLVSGELEALKLTDIKRDARARVELMKLMHDVKENGYELVEYDIRYPKGLGEEFKKLKSDLLNLYLKIDMAMGDESVSVSLLKEVEEDIAELMSEYMLTFQKKLRKFFVPQMSDLRRSG